MQRKTEGSQAPSPPLSPGPRSLVSSPGPVCPILLRQQTKTPLPTTRSPTASSMHPPSAATSTSACMKAMEVRAESGGRPSWEEGWWAPCSHGPLQRQGHPPSPIHPAFFWALLGPCGWSRVWPEVISPSPRPRAVSPQPGLSLHLRPMRQACRYSRKQERTRVHGGGRLDQPHCPRGRSVRLPPGLLRPHSLSFPEGAVFT